MSTIATLPRRRQSRCWTNLLAGLVVVLGACTPVSDAQRPTGPPPSDYYVERVQLLHEVRFQSDRTSIDAIEVSRLRSFLIQNGRDQGDIVAVLSAGPQGDQRSAAVAATIDQLGVGPARLGQLRQDRNVVVVVVDRRVFIPTACLNRGPQPTINRTFTVPLACSNAHNLSRMVSNSDELVLGGTPASPAESSTGIIAIDRYRTGQTQPLLIDDGL